MNKVKINLIGHTMPKNLNHRNYLHGAICTSPLNSPKYVEWVTDGSANISIHHDQGMTTPVDRSKKNYGWILESTTIVGDFINEVIRNLDYYRQNFECIFTHDKRLCELDDFFKFTIPPPMSYIQNKKIYEKTKDISVIMSTTSDRPPYVYRTKCLELIKSKDVNNIVDVYGRGRGDKELPWLFDFEGKPESGKILGLKDYRFSFAFDNNNYNTIFSDKLTDCFATGTIPIWWGGSDIGNYFDVDGVIFWNENIDLNTLTENFYQSKMKSIKENLNIISNMISAEDYIYINYLK